MNVVTSSVIRAGRPQLLALNRVVGGFSNAAFIVVLIFTPLPGYVVLTASFICSTLMGVGVMVQGLPGWLSRVRLAHSHDWRIVRREVGWQPLNNLAANLGTALPALMLPALGSALVAGSWALLSRVMNAVVNIVNSTAGPLYNTGFAELVRTRNSVAVSKFHWRWLLRLLFLVFPSIIGIIIGVRWVIPLLGEQWLVTSMVVIPACLSFTMLLVWLPMSQTLVLIGRIRLEMAWTLGNLLASAATLGLIPWLGGKRALILWAATQAISLGIHILLQRWAISTPSVSDPAPYRSPDQRPTCPGPPP